MTSPAVAAMHQGAPGMQSVSVQLDAVGGSGAHFWLLDGQQVASGNGGTHQAVQLSGSRMHSVAVIDAAGHDDAVTVHLD